MKKTVLSFLFMTLIVPLASSCSTDTHYDSVSSNITLNIPDLPDDGSSVTVHQRFQFDRDLAPLSSMNLVEAWLSAPAVDYTWDDETKERLDSSYSLDMVQAVSISLVEADQAQPVFWMVIPSAQLQGRDAMFSDFNLGDLRQYMDSYQQIELEIHVTLDPYHKMRYWRDVCRMKDSCTVQLPLSMHFKMED